MANKKPIVIVAIAVGFGTTFKQMKANACYEAAKC